MAVEVLQLVPLHAFASAQTILHTTFVRTATAERNGAYLWVAQWHVTFGQSLAAPGVRCNALQVYISCWPLPLRLPVGSNASERPMDWKRLNVEMTGMGMMDLVGDGLVRDDDYGFEKQTLHIHKTSTQIQQNYINIEGRPNAIWVNMLGKYVGK